MTNAIVGAARQTPNPTFEVDTVDSAILQAVRAEMRRVEARADWVALVAECAARGMP